MAVVLICRKDLLENGDEMLEGVTSPSDDVVNKTAVWGGECIEVLEATP